MNIYYLTNFHISHGCIKTFDHLTCTTYKFQRLTTIIRGIKLGSIIERTSIMGTTCFAHIAACQCTMRSASTAAVTSTGMSFPMITTAVTFLMMMITICSGRYQFTLQISFNSLIHIALSSGTQLNPCLRKCILCTSANATANQHIHCLISKQTGQSTMSGSIGTNHFTGNHLIIFNLIHLKKLCSSKMLENFSIIIRYCYLHT